MKYLLYLIFILAINCFGLYSWQYFAVGRNSLGFIIVTTTSIFVIIDQYKNRNKDSSNSLKSIINLIFILIGLQLVRNYMEGVSLKDIIAGISLISPIFIVIPLVDYLNSKARIETFVNFILIVGFISSLICIFQFISGKQLQGSMVSIYNGTYNRIYHPGAILMAFCFFIQFSRYFIYGYLNKNSKSLLFAPFYIIGIGLTLHRSLISLLIIGILVIFVFYYFYSNRFYKRKRILSILLVFFLFFGLISNSSIAGLFQDRYDEGKTEVMTNEGNYAFRFLIITKSLEAIYQSNFLFGKGFNYNTDMSQFDPLGLTADADYGNVVVNFGYTGLLLWVLLYIQMLIASIKLYIKELDPFYKMLLLAIIPMPILFLSIGFFGQVMHYTPNLIILITCFAFIKSIKSISNKEKLSKLI